LALQEVAKQIVRAALVYPVIHMSSAPVSEGQAVAAREEVADHSAAGVL
jgi:disulfide oxidoreductase YuzD